MFFFIVGLIIDILSFSISVASLISLFFRASELHLRSCWLSLCLFLIKILWSLGISIWDFPWLPFLGRVCTCAMSEHISMNLVTIWIGILLANLWVQDLGSFLSSLFGHWNIYTKIINIFRVWFTISNYCFYQSCINTLFLTL